MTFYKIIVGDCVEIMKGLEDNSIDVILTDPPYKDDDVMGDYYEWFGRFFQEAMRVSKDYVIFFNNASRLYDILQKFGRPYRILIWSKGVVKYAWRWEPIFIYASKNPSFKMTKLIWSDHLPYQPLHRKQSLHQYEKPIGLMEQLIRYIPNDKTILDPFLGSGTTIVAARKLNRSCIGIEIDSETVEIAKKRLRIGEQLDTGVVDYEIMEALR